MKSNVRGLSFLVVVVVVVVVGVERDRVLLWPRIALMIAECGPLELMPEFATKL
jgi:hypothetical protein